MSAINDIPNPIPSSPSAAKVVSGAPETPREQVASGLLGGSANPSTSESPTAVADSTLVELSGAATSIASQLAAGVPPDLAAASQLVTQLSAEIGQQGLYAATAQGLLSAGATLSLLKA